MLKYIMLLCCLIATQAEAIKSRKRLSRDQIQICIAKKKAKKLAFKLDEHHLYLKRMIKIHNKTLAIAELKSRALKKWKFTTIGYSFDNMPKRLLKPYKGFSEALIKSSDDLQEYYPLSEKINPIELYRDTKELIGQIEDFDAQGKLESDLNKAFRHAIVGPFDN